MANQILQLPMGPRGKSISTVVKYGSVLALGFLVAPYIFIAIGGLIGLGVAAVVLALGSALAPTISLKIANFATKKLIQEIRENPVESRIKVYNDRFESLTLGAEDLRKFQVSISTFASKLDGLIKTYPEDAAKFQSQLATMKQLLELRYKGWEAAKESLENYAAMTQRVRAIWEMTLASDELHMSAGRLQETAHMQIINDETIRVAEDGMARSFANLDHLLRMEQIEAGPSNVIPINEPKMLEKAADGVFVLPSLTVTRSDKIAA